MSYINLQVLFNSLIYSMVGVVVFWIAFLAIDKLTPAYNLWHQVVHEKNVALAVLVGCMCLGLAIIVAAAIHG